VPTGAVLGKFFTICWRCFMGYLYTNSGGISSFLSVVLFFCVVRKKKHDIHHIFQGKTQANAVYKA
jgi:hypothetical protein